MRTIRPRRILRRVLGGRRAGRRGWARGGCLPCLVLALAALGLLAAALVVLAWATRPPAPPGWRA